MNLYLIQATTSDRQEIRSQYVGSQADAAKLRKELTEQGFKRADIVTSEVDVPTNKSGLLNFLNNQGE